MSGVLDDSIKYMAELRAEYEEVSRKAKEAETEFEAISKTVYELEYRKAILKYRMLEMGMEP